MCAAWPSAISQVRREGGKTEHQKIKDDILAISKLEYYSDQDQIADTFNDESIATNVVLNKGCM